MLFDVMPEVIISQSNPIITLDKESIQVNAEGMIPCERIEFDQSFFVRSQCDSRDYISSIKRLGYSDGRFFRVIFSN